MADKLVTIGINSISLQEIDSTGTDVGTPIELGETLLDSFALTNDAGTPVEIFVEEQDGAIYSRQGNATTTMTWQSPNVDAEALAAVTGGAWDGPSSTYSAPAKRTVKDYRVIIDVEQGYVITYNRVSITAEFDGNLGKNNAFMLTVNGTVLTPNNSDAPYELVVKA